MSISSKLYFREKNKRLIGDSTSCSIWKTWKAKFELRKWTVLVSRIKLLWPETQKKKKKCQTETGKIVTMHTEDIEDLFFAETRGVI